MEIVVINCNVYFKFWTAAYQAPPSIGFSRQEYWSGVPLPSPNLNKRLLKKNLPCHVDCGILVLQPGIKPWPLAVRAWSPDHWAAREFPKVSFFDSGNLKIMKQLCHSKNDHVLLLWNMETYLGFGIFSWLAIFKKNDSVNKLLIWKYEIIGYII